MVYCTLFGFNYADKGIVMLKSLIANDRNAKVYVLTMDLQCYNILLWYNLSGVKLIKLEEFEDNELLSVKPKRSFGEYCWSCTAKLIRFVLICHNEHQCTYVDADLFFYSNPAKLISEMQKEKCSVQTTRHRFPNTRFGRFLAKKYGENCVQFVTFIKERKSLILLDEWIDLCLDECSVNSGGDQRYTDSWKDKVFVNICRNGGAGVAPWNINRYKLRKKKGYLLYDKFDRCNYKLVFYHFQNVVFTKKNIVRLNVQKEHWIIDKELVQLLYSGYIKKLEIEKKTIEKNFGVWPSVDKYISDATLINKKWTWQRIASFVKKSYFEKFVIVSDKILNVIRKKSINYVIDDEKI